MPRIENRFMELLEVKRRKDKKKRWSYREIAEAIGISPATLTRFAQQRHNQYDSETLITLCGFLECEVGDLLVLVEDDDPVYPGSESTLPIQVVGER
jgi:DNA-binding Xre family transcriptional regulator